MGSASARNSGTVTFLLLRDFFANEKINPGSGPVCRIHFNVVTSQDATTCIRLEDNASDPFDVKNQLSPDHGLFAIFPSLKPGSLLLGKGNPGTGCPSGAFTQGDLNLDENLTPPDAVLELNCVFLSGSWDCPVSLADLNCDGQLTAADAVEILNRAFLGTPPVCP
jgi:hypothetical protein